MINVSSIMRTLRIPRILLLLGIVLLLPGRAARAQDGNADSNQVLTVRDAIELATRSNPELSIDRNAISRARAARWNAFGTTGLEVSHTREGIPDGGSGFGEQKWAAGLTLPFPMRSVSEWQAAARSAESRSLAADASFLALRAQVKEAYARLLFAQEMVHLRQQEVDLATTLVEVVSARVDVGESAQVDLMKVQLERSSAANALRDAELQFQNSRYSLFQVIGVDPEAQRYDIVFPDTLVYRAVDIQQDDVMSGLERHPGLEAAARETEASRMSLKASNFGMLPDLYAGWFQQDFGTGYQFHGFEVGVRIGIPGIDSRRAVRETSRLNVLDAEQVQFRTELDLKRQAESAWHGFETTQAAVRAYTGEQNQRAEDLLQRTREGYQLGQLDLLTVLDAQRVYLDVQRTYYVQLRDYYLQLIQLERLMARELVFVEEGGDGP